MQIPVYVITGFLSEGKTSFLNGLLHNTSKALVIQFESGQEPINIKNSNFSLLNISKKDFENKEGFIADEIYKRIKDYNPKEIWIEWNGVIKFSKLYELFLYPLLYKACFIKKVIHIACADTLDMLIGRTGEALLEQISNCDIFVIRNIYKNSDFVRIKKMIKSINSTAKVYKIEEAKSINEKIFLKNRNQIKYFLFGIVLIILAYFMLIPVLNSFKFPVHLIIVMFLGIVLESFPFLLIGVLISSFIQVFITKEAIERRFPKKLGLGMLYAILFGFFLPVCDCAAIPIFKSLVKKGIPISIAVTFMTASPVINPVVILSTYYAFNGDILIVLTRLGLGIICSVLVGVFFYAFPSKENVLNKGFDGSLCNCGCFEGVEGVVTLKGKISLFLRHSQTEFFNVGKFLLIGAFASSVFQVAIKKSYFNHNLNVFISLLVMMVLAFLFSLCSSSDAIIAKSFESVFPMVSVMGFLVFGPMIDVKNVILLSSGFSNKFIGKIILVTFVVCFLCVFIIGSLSLGG